jgi:hypothetical protein
VWGVRAERNLSQRRQGGSGRSVKVVAVGRHVCIRGVWYRRSSLGTRDRGASPPPLESISGAVPDTSRGLERLIEVLRGRW